MLLKEDVTGEKDIIDLDKEDCFILKSSDHSTQLEYQDKECTIFEN